ncbi:solute carrier organic anion transporter family member 4A1-like isoform X2 [Lytechinus variegatus]|uniref:solute carrier organic anion transporter family member 4A1-like isoform X2 n=1 Tax=Lytechinus variegatus TaxID=7654 RepID=UPI001BB1DEED|nr:solute carrier organic anion transporter family member 4A1-like isoform X2 [Lytechinus variegatus]
MTGTSETTPKHIEHVHTVDVRDESTDGSLQSLPREGEEEDSDMTTLMRVRLGSRRSNDSNPILGDIENNLDESSDGLDVLPSSADAVRKPRSNTYAGFSSKQPPNYYHNEVYESDSRRGSLRSSCFSQGDLGINGALGINGDLAGITDHDLGMKVRSSLSLPRDRGGMVVINAAIGEKLAMSNLEQYSMLPMTKETGNNNFDDDEEDPASTSKTGSMKPVDGSQVAEEAESEEEFLACGWFFLRPKCLQVFNNPKGYLFVLCFLGLLQNMTVLGYLPVVITTLERRFRLTSVQTGFIVIAYDISNLIVCAFVSYFGERGRKPVWVGLASMLYSVGSVIFALPHFLAGEYQYGIMQDDVCPALSNVTSGSSCGEMTSSSDNSMLLYYWLFIIGQVLHGWGGSTLYTVGITYMDESLPSSTFGLYMGIFTAMNAVGPALGYLIGGAMLSDLYNDITTPLSSLDITPDNPVWVGAWWLGFLINAALIFIFAFLNLGFPKKLPVMDKILQEKRNESQAGCEFESRDGSYLEVLQDFPKALLGLFKNPPFIFLSLIATCEWFVYAGLTTFGPKFFESQLNISAGDASYDIGIISVSAGIVGSLISGVLMKRLNLSVRGLLKLSVICAVVSLLSQFVFLFPCPDIPFAGVTVPYGNGQGTLNSTNISAPCHGSCACSDTFDPVCGEDDILYYSACHAGCSAQEQTLDGKIQYMNCSCVSNPAYPNGDSFVSGTVERGRCSQKCGYRWLFYILMFVALISTSMLIVPTWAATVRCVEHSLRGLALGVQTVMYGALGNVPAPVVFGLLIDRSCLLWETACNGSRSCWLYDNKQFANSFFLLTVIFKSSSLIFCIAALLSYKPVSAGVPTDSSPSNLPEFARRFSRKVSIRLSTKTRGSVYPVDT